MVLTVEDGKMRKKKGYCVTMKNRRVSSTSHVSLSINRLHQMLLFLIFMIVISYTPFFNYHQLGVVNAAPYILVTDNRPNCKRFLVPGHSTVVIHYVSPDLFSNSPTWISASAMPIIREHDIEKHKDIKRETQTWVIHAAEDQLHLPIVDRSELAVCIRAQMASKINAMMFSIKVRIIPHYKFKKRRKKDTSLSSLNSEKNSLKDDNGDNETHTSASSKSRLELEYVHMEVISEQMIFDLEAMKSEAHALNDGTREAHGDMIRTYQAALFWPIFKIGILIIISLHQLNMMLQYFRRKDVKNSYR